MSHTEKHKLKCRHFDSNIKNNNSFLILFLNKPMFEVAIMRSVPSIQFVHVDIVADHVVFVLWMYVIGSIRYGIFYTYRLRFRQTGNKRCCDARNNYLDTFSLNVTRDERVLSSMQYDSPERHWTACKQSQWVRRSDYHCSFQPTGVRCQSITW